MQTKGKGISLPSNFLFVGILHTCLEERETFTFIFCIDKIQIVWHTFLGSGEKKCFRLLATEAPFDGVMQIDKGERKRERVNDVLWTVHTAHREKERERIDKTGSSLSWPQWKIRKKVKDLFFFFRILATSATFDAPFQKRFFGCHKL